MCMKKLHEGCAFFRHTMRHTMRHWCDIQRICLAIFLLRGKTEAGEEAATIRQSPTISPPLN